MKRTRFRNKFLKHPTDENRLAYTKQINFWLSLRKKEKKEYFANLIEKNITDNRKFWLAVKPLISEKNKSREKITLVKNEEVIYNDAEVANTLKKFFSNI